MRVIETYIYKSRNFRSSGEDVFLFILQTENRSSRRYRFYSSIARTVTSVGHCETNPSMTNRLSTTRATLNKSETLVPDAISKVI